MTEPKWTTTPPTEPGFYFWRRVNKPRLHVEEVTGRGRYEVEASTEWWSVRIEEPMTRDEPNRRER